jgi:eukaryotic-like serine/threonine-protein kinase
MSDAHPQDPEAPDVALARQVDAICRKFEADWRAGLRPAIGDYLGDVAEECWLTLRAELEALEKELLQADETAAGREPGSIEEAATISPGPPKTPILGDPHTLVHEEATLPPTDQPHLLHDQPTAAVLGQDPPATPGASKPNRIRYFGDYEILRELARGGMGVVFQARQVSLNRRVALKMILAGQLATDIDVKRFYTEAEAAANLDHPGIVPIFEVGQHEGQHYFSMGFVEGQSLAQRLADGPLPPREAATLLVSVAEAIEYAHGHGVIHRDLKPANILLDRNGYPRVTDFGLAKKLEGDSGLTGSGQIMGTPSYMPPEQAGGKRGDVGPKADVYALGATLYALVTGRPPFQASTPMDTVLQVISDEPVPPRRLNGSIPLDLETICLKCLEKEQGKRYVSAADLGEDLRHYLAGEPITARPVSQAERAWRWCKRSPWLAGAIGSAAALLLAVAMLSLRYADQQARYARDQADATEQIKGLLGDVEKEGQVARGEARRAETALTESSKRLGYLALERGLASCEKEDVGRGLLWLAAGLRAADQAKDPVLQHTSRVNLATWMRQLNALEGIFTPGGMVHLVAIRPDGKVILTVAQDTGLLWDVKSGQRLGSPLRHRGMIYVAAFSPDGKAVLTNSMDRTTRLWDATTGAPLGEPIRHETLRSPADTAGKPAPPKMTFFPARFSLDGRTILTDRLRDRATLQPIELPWTREVPGRIQSYSPDFQTVVTDGADRTFVLRETRTGRAIGAPLLHEAPPDVGEFSPDGISLVTSDRGGSVRLWDARSGQAVGQPIPLGASLARVLFLDRGKALLTIDKGGKARAWDVRTGAARGTAIDLPLLAGGFANVVGSPDDATFLGADDSGSARLWDAANGQPVGSPLIHSRQIMGLALGPGGRTALTGGFDGVARLWGLAESPRDDLALAHPAMAFAAAFSPNGQILLTAGGPVARLWDVRTGRPLGEPLAHPSSVFGLEFGPDGKTFLTYDQGQSVRLWDATSRRLIGGPLKHQPNPNVPNAGAILASTYSPDGMTILTGGSDHFARFWEAATGRPIGPSLTHPGMVTEVRYSPDGRTALTVCFDNSVYLWDISSGRPVGQPLKHLHRILPGAVFFSPDGKVIVTGCDDSADWLRNPTGVVRLWNAADGRLIGKPLEYRGWACTTMRPDGKVLVTTGSDGRSARLWDAANGQPVGEPLRHDDLIYRAVFSPEGSKLVTTCEDGTARFWDGATGRSLGVVLKHPRRVNAAAFSPDGRVVATGCLDGKVRLWDAASGQPVGKPASHSVKATGTEPRTDPEVVQVGFSPDGKAVVSRASGDFDVHLLRVQFEMGGDPESNQLVVQVFTGLELDDQGAVRPLAPATWWKRRAELTRKGEPGLVKSWP